MSEVFWSLWLIRSATSIRTLFTVIIGKIFGAVFHLRTGVRELFVTLFNWSSERSEFFATLWFIRSATSIQTVFTVIIGKLFSADFTLKTGVRGLFLILFIWSSEKSEVFSSLWLIRCATSIQTFFTVIIGKNFSADFQLKTGVREFFRTLSNLSSEKIDVFWSLWLIRIATSIQKVFTVTTGKIFSAVFRLKTGVREKFVPLFNWSSEKSEVFSSLWLIRSATSIQTVFKVIIAKKFSAEFHLKTGVRELFLTLFNCSSGDSEFFATLWLIGSATSIQTIFTVIIGKIFSADFHLKTGVREFFLTLFNWSSGKSDVFATLWLIRCATSIQTVFTVIIGKIFSADFHLKTGVRGLFLILFLWSSEKSEVSSSLWLIRRATSIQTVFTVIIGKNFSADFQLKTGVREFF